MALRDHADDPGGHVTEHLESYLLGVLPAAQEYEVESHLLRCAGCRAEADASSELAVAVATLTPEDVQAIESGGPAAGAGRTEPRSGRAKSGRAKSGRAKSGRAKSGRAESASPADTRPGSLPSQRRASRRKLVVYAAVLVVGFVVGAVGVLWISPGSINGQPAGNDSLDSTSGRLTVTLTDRGVSGVDVRAVVVGLRPGLAYELIAVGQDGRNQTVARGVAAGGPQTLQGRFDGPATGILFFAVMQPDADVLFVTPVP